ncbi:MAG TPA: type II secretion system protein [Noviherbaspirillum sp.]|nr:type II secretion system protein [Noviherbaspirillum sp.]
MCTKCQVNRMGGLTLIELVLFIVIVSVGLAGILSVMNITTRNSADPMIRKQALAIAESLLEEVKLQPFTFCDPDDPNNLEDPPPASEAECSAGFDESTTLGAETGEGRYQAATPYDNVNDYAGFAMNGIRAIENGAVVVPGLESYNAAVAIEKISDAESAALGVDSPDDVLRIQVRVTGPASTDIRLTGYRFRYAPNAT